MPSYNTQSHCLPLEIIPLSPCYNQYAWYAPAWASPIHHVLTGSSIRHGLPSWLALWPSWNITPSAYKDLHAYLFTLRLRQSGHHFADDIFECIFLNAHLWIVIKISLKFVPKGQINNIILINVGYLTEACLTGPQWLYTVFDELGDCIFTKSPSTFFFNPCHADFFSLDS